MDIFEFDSIKKQSIDKIKKEIRLYSKVNILYQGKLINGTVISIDLKGIKIKENNNNQTYRWKYVLSLNY